MAVVAPRELHDPASPRDAPREPDGAHRGLGSRIDQAYLLHRAHPIDQFDRELYFARLAAGGGNQTGDLRLSELAAATGSATSVAVAWTGDELGVAYATDGGASADSNVLLTRRDLEGAAIAAEVPVADGPESSLDVDIVSTGLIYAIAWADDRDGNVEIYLREVAP